MTNLWIFVCGNDDMCVYNDNFIYEIGQSTILNYMREEREFVR